MIGEPVIAQHGRIPAKTLGMPKASLTNWVRADANGQLGMTAGKRAVPVIRPEQAEIARLKMERDIAKIGHRGSAPSQWKETPSYLYRP